MSKFQFENKPWLFLQHRLKRIKNKKDKQIGTNNDLHLQKTHAKYIQTNITK